MRLNVFFKGISPKINVIAHRKFDIPNKDCQVGYGCSILRLHLCKRLRHLNECLVYDTNQSDGEVPVMLELLRMRSTPSLPSLPGPHLPGVVAPDRALSMGEIELNCVLRRNWIAWNRTNLTFNCVWTKTILC